MHRTPELDCTLHVSPIHRRAGRASGYARGKSKFARARLSVSRARSAVRVSGSADRGRLVAPPAPSRRGLLSDMVAVSCALFSPGLRRLAAHSIATSRSAKRCRTSSQRLSLAARGAHTSCSDDTTIHRHDGFRVHQFPILDDNYSYLIVDGVCVCVCVCVCLCVCECVCVCVCVAAFHTHTHTHAHLHTQN